METLKIKSRRCDLKELRTLKAINSVPTRAVKCSLISKADLEALCTSCKSLSPRRRKRKRKSKRREQLLLHEPGQLFSCRGGGCCEGPGHPTGPPAPRRARSATPLLPQPVGGYEKPPRGAKGFGLAARGALGLRGCPRERPLLRAALPSAPAGPRCSQGLFPGEKGPGGARKGRACGCPGSKRQGTSAGYSSDSDSSLDFGGSSPATSSDSSEEEEEEEEGDSSCSSEEGSSSESESSSLCSGDSVQSTRYRQAALPRLQPPREPSGSERAAEPPPSPCSKGDDLHKAASDNSGSLGPAERAETRPGPPPEPGPASVPPPGEPRREHFDRLIRQSKLWCYAKGFNVDAKSLRLVPKRCRVARGAERQSSPKGRPPKTPRRKARKGNPPCKRLGSAGPPPPRNSFSLMGSFPCIPSLIVGDDGDLCPASSLGGKNSWALSKTHPLWSWHLGGNAMPVPPSLKFRGYSLEDP
uniref:SKI/SNO/DAC domain-containing protein n=1 Tax=Nothoprocta perdicaria TaxID=30464 RepID=A0A8C6ZH95_NOTPE